MPTDLMICVRPSDFNTLLDGITSGHIDRGDIHEYAVLARNASNATNAASRTINLTALLFRPTVEMYGAEAIGALLSLHPVIGSILSAFEAATGRNVAGQQLSNWQRGMAVGFAIFPFARQAKSGQAAAQIANRLSFLSTTTAVARRSRLAQAGDFVRAASGCGNSFSADTPVRTIAGLVTISALTLGTPVLAYNEATGEQGYYPVTDVISYGVQDQPITSLSIRSQDGGDEVIKATPNHPFYLVDTVDGGERPQPEGYNLGANWVGAGDLKIGDTVRRSDGSTGTVVQTATVGETRQVYNLTVNTAHTYFVGEQEWLVHNAGRGSNNLQSDPRARDSEGRPVGHTTFRRNPVTGQITNYVEYAPNPRNPNGFDEVKRVDISGGAHFNPATGRAQPTPHVHVGKKVREALPEEVPGCRR